MSKFRYELWDGGGIKAFTNSLSAVANWVAQGGDFREVSQ